MMKNTFKIVLLFFGIGMQLFAHSGKPDHHIIIDTDGALDDMRAISMLLSAEDVSVLAITGSQGAILPDSACIKVHSLLSAFYHEGIPIGTGSNLDKKLADWSAFVQTVSWNNPQESGKTTVIQDANKILNGVTKGYRKKITLIALGSLKTYADWIRSNPKIIDKIERVIWYNNSDIKQGFNYNVSPESFDFIRQSGVTLEIVSNNTDQFYMDELYLNTLRSIGSKYANQIEKVHTVPTVMEQINQHRILFWDDIVPLYLHEPDLFKSETIGNIKLLSLDRGLSKKVLYSTIAEILESGTHTNDRVFNHFPIDSTLYKPAYIKILNSTIEKYGVIEWKAISMTNEIHGHTGIYSIIGAKMGIRAMEYFNVGVNNLTVTTFAGRKPPLSCFNDGIQISSGATIGQGLITISDSILTIPTATFTFNDQKIRISLKPEIASQMQKEIKYGIETYGLLTAQYWQYIEELAIRYWSEFDRHKVFIIVKE